MQIHEKGRQVERSTFYEQEKRKVLPGDWIGESKCASSSRSFTQPTSQHGLSPSKALGPQLVTRDGQLCLGRERGQPLLLCSSFSSPRVKADPSHTTGP